MPADQWANGVPVVDPFYPDGYVSSDQDRASMEAQKAKYAATTNAVNFKFPLLH